MRYTSLLAVAALIGVSAGSSYAAPSAEDIAKLGKSLTPFGAIKAGNADGTIPAWDGGICTPPPGYNPVGGMERGGGPYIDPFADEKPRLVITAQNYKDYADKLDPGIMELFARYPDTYRMNVYPTHRTACFPDWVYKNTIEGAGKAELVGDAPGLGGDIHAQIPFPIPENGYQVMWNTVTKYEPANIFFHIDATLTDSSGSMTHTLNQQVYNYNAYWDTTLDEVPEGEPYWVLISRTFDPPASAGVAQMRHQFLRADEYDPMAWSYVPGQRRVRQAPDFTYDTVSTSSGGILLFDEINGFDGKMDRFDFKLVGLQEKFVPYNAYAYNAASNEELSGPDHVNPDLERWELHRVWVVDATLKPGARHVEKQKIFYVDEDSWNILSYVGIDHAGEPYHAVYLPAMQLYDKPMIRNTGNHLYDFNRRMYSLASRAHSPGQPGIQTVEPYPPYYFTPDAFAASGVR
jgi:hypothetical protein